MKSIFIIFFAFSISLSGAGTGKSKLSGDMHFAVINHMGSIQKYAKEADSSLQKTIGLKTYIDYIAMGTDCLLKFSKQKNLYTQNEKNEKFWVLEDDKTVDTLICKANEGDLLIDWSKWQVVNIQGHKLVPYFKEYKKNNEMFFEALVDFKAKFYETTKK